MYTKSKCHHFPWSIVGHETYQKYMTEIRGSLLKRNRNSDQVPMSRYQVNQHYHFTPLSLPPPLKETEASSLDMKCCLYTATQICVSDSFSPLSFLFMPLLFLISSFVKTYTLSQASRQPDNFSIFLCIYHWTEMKINNPFKKCACTCMYY